MKAILSCIGKLMVLGLFTRETMAAPSGVELDSDLFEQLIADKEQTKVKDGQTWFIFFDSPQACNPRDLCGDVTEMWQELFKYANVE